MELSKVKASININKDIIESIINSVFDNVKEHLSIVQSIINKAYQMYIDDGAVYGES
ncbi:MAG: hypothetical protein ACOCRK_07460 [bacterium]